MARTPLFSSFLALSCIVAGCRTPGGAAASGAGAVVQLVAFSSVASAGGVGAETVGMQAASGRMVLSNSDQGTVEVYSLEDPTLPRLLAVHDLGLQPGEEITCVAVHPRHDLFAAAIRAADPRAAGRAQLHELSGGALQESLSAGIEPDSIAFDPTGRFALVANEGESCWRPRPDGPFASSEGSLTWIALNADGQVIETRQLALPDATGRAGFVSAAAGRFLEREVDGETLLVPLLDGRASMLEPEVVAFRPDGAQALVTLQENNGVVVVDVATGTVLDVRGLGTTSHVADLIDDGEVRIEERMVALREPDGVAYTSDGRYFVTADEGDTEPKASKTEPGKPMGGGRTLSVFDAQTGAFVGDTGGALDLACQEAGCYPDGRSDSKGCEPEMVVTFATKGRSFALVTLERADALALVELSDPSRPRVLDVARTRGAGPHGPEGLAHFAAPDGRHYAYSANEESGAIGVFRVEP